MILTGDHQSGSNITDLVGLLEGRMRLAIGGSPTLGASLNSDGIFVVSGAFGIELLWDNGATNLDASIFGFAQSRSSDNNTSVSGTMRPAGTWLPARAPTEDTYDLPVVVASTAKAVSGRQSTIRLDDGTQRKRAMEFSLELRPNVIQQHWTGQTGVSGTLQTFFNEGLGSGHIVRYYEDKTEVLDDTQYTPYKPDDQKEAPYTRRKSTLGTFYDVAFNWVSVDDETDG